MGGRGSVRARWGDRRYGVHVNSTGNQVPTFVFLVSPSHFPKHEHNMFREVRKMEKGNFERGHTLEGFPWSKSTDDQPTKLDCWRKCIDEAGNLESEFKCASACGGFG
jgi:hypothetical protein